LQKWGGDEKKKLFFFPQFGNHHFGRSLPNHQLHTVAAACGYSLINHHHALADAEACAAIALKIL
jgi:DNA polymerase III epsilon subunit-like protein